MRKEARETVRGVFGLLSFILLISAALILGTGTEPARAAKGTEVGKSAAGLVDINSATQAELEGIKGIGPATAKKIIAGRPYKSVDELSKAGFNAKSVDAMKPLVTVGNAQPAAKASVPVAAAASDLKKEGKGLKSTAAKDAKSAAATKLAPGTKVNINTADKASLEALPEIGPVKAQAIIDGRPYKSPEDVMKVGGIKQKTFDAIKGYIVVK